MIPRIRKALTVWPPWAELIASGLKPVANARGDVDRCGRCHNPLSVRMRCTRSEEVCVDECGPGLLRAPENAMCERCKEGARDG